MLFVSIIEQDRPPHVLGAIACIRLQPVTDYVWLRPFEEHYQVEVVLRDYSRWSEPATGLLARLLARRSADAVRKPLVQGFTCQLRVGQHVDRTRLIEQLDVTLVGPELSVVHRDELVIDRKTAPRRDEYATLDSLLVHAARLSAWGADTEPPIPAPLSQVPIRELHGQQVVFEVDMPLHARRHFLHRHQGSSVPRPDFFYASDWLAFLGA